MYVIQYFFGPDCMEMNNLLIAASCLPGDCGSDPGEGLPVQPADPGGVQEPKHEQPRAAAWLRGRGRAQWRWDDPQRVRAEQGGEAAPLGGAGRHQGQAAQIQTGAVRSFFFFLSCFCSRRR